MVFLYVFGGIVALVGLALFLPVNVTLKYKSSDALLEGKSECVVYYWFFKIFPAKQKEGTTHSPPKKNKEPTENKQPIENKNASVPKSEQNVKKQERTAPPKADTLPVDFLESGVGDLKQLKELIGSIIKPIGRVFGKIKIKSLEIICVSGGDDAAKTALNYGLCCTAIYSFVEWLSLKMSMRRKKIKIAADWEQPKTILYLDLKFALRLGTVLLQLGSLVSAFIKNNYKKGGKYG
ncbi:MAG: DUF2953 domain-containing protein [Oscillospiraceae bacterium]|nr:DUF2953 domain-containing protein [Oscillospiraceae bacterium]